MVYDPFYKDPKGRHWFIEGTLEAYFFKADHTAAGFLDKAKIRRVENRPGAAVRELLFSYPQGPVCNNHIPWSSYTIFLKKVLGSV